MVPKKFTSQVATSWLRGFFYLLYHQFAWTYDFIAWTVSLGMWREWVFSIKPFLSGQDILELGHGPGHLQVTLKNNNHKVVGIDESKQMVRTAYRRIIKAGHKPLILRSYAQKLPIVDKSFHHVVSTFPTEYITNPDTISEAYRVLVPGGSMVLLPIAWITGKHVLARSTAWLFRITGQSPDWDDQYLEPFNKAGFRTQAHTSDLRSSRVLIIIAEKQ
jgi:ubiquinone/menaquinone biosynthesis C-methylase UbiE